MKEASQSKTNMANLLRAGSDSTAHSESELAETARRLRQLEEATADGIWDLDIRTNHVWYSRSWYTMLGYDPDDLPWSRDENPFLELIHPEDKERVLEAMRAHTEGREPAYQAEFRMRARNGDWRWILSRGKVVERAPTGSPLRAVGTHMDVSEWQSLAERLEKSQRRHLAFLKSVPDLVFLVRRDGVVLDYHAAREELLVAAPDEITGRNLTEIMESPLAERFIALFGRALDEGSTQTTEYSLDLPDGTHYFEARIAPYDDGHVSAIVRDITEKEHAVREMRRIQERLHQAERLHGIGQLASGIAHDFNNQMNSIMFLGDMLKKGATDPAKVRRYADMMVRRSASSSELTNRLMAFARTESTEPEQTDAHELIREVIALIEYTFDKNIGIRSQLRAENTWVTTDRSQLENALLNLAINARDAMPDGGEILFATDDTDLEAGPAGMLGTVTAAGAHLRIRVVDTGTGIKPDILEHVFEPFVTTKDPSKGYGLGLASVADTVRALNGSVDIESVLDEGTSFILCLPAKARPKAKPTQKASAKTAGHGHILVVDDEDLFREVVGDQLRTMGYSVTLCAGGAEALAECARRGSDFDVVVLDLVMPRVDGQHVLMTLRQTDPHARILVISGAADRTPPRQLEGCRACAFLRKPFTPAQLSEELQRLIGT